MLEPHPNRLGADVPNVTTAVDDEVGVARLDEHLGYQIDEESLASGAHIDKHRAHGGERLAVPRDGVIPGWRGAGWSTGRE